MNDMSNRILEIFYCFCLFDVKTHSCAEFPHGWLNYLCLVDVWEVHRMKRRVRCEVHHEEE